MGTAGRALRAARGYLTRNPGEIARAVRSAIGLRFGLPVAALRWLAEQAERAGKLEDVKIDAVPPGIRFAANVDLMKTPVRASAVVYIERVDLSDEEMRVSLRLEEVSLKMNGDAATPVAALIKSGVLDLSKPGNLAAHLPGLPPVLAEARDNRIVLDFMRDPKLGKSEIVRNAVGLLSSIVTVHAIETDDSHLEVGLRALPRGVRAAVGAFRRHLIMPSMGRLLPG
jgi:hypothetical protein